MVEDMDIITLQDEDGREHRFNLVDTLEVDGRRYAVLLPEDEEDAAAVIFRMEGEDRLVSIDDDEELNRVMAALEETGYSEVILEGDDEEPGGLDVLGEMRQSVDGDGDDVEDEDDEVGEE
ncbi:MAG: DUF1292 domain-containing protein [Armatimonadota bacterium]|nr:DUF1292 domain-containing protein [Armatimonadota bacterium]MDR7550370.1 DUF1292 domain-containing protein [Armatimonadota bacterium]